MRVYTAGDWDVVKGPLNEGLKRVAEHEIIEDVYTGGTTSSLNVVAHTLGAKPDRLFVIARANGLGDWWYTDADESAWDDKTVSFRADGTSIRVDVKVEID